MEDIVIEEEEPEIMEMNDSEDIVDIKVQLKKCQKSKILIEKEYFKCEQELKKKTEECEKMKTEIKDLKLIIDLKSTLEPKADDADVEIDCPQKEVINPWMKKGNGINDRKKTKEQSLPAEEYNCMDCAFQGTSNGELRNHINLKHRVNVNKEIDGNIECRNCGERFLDKRNLMNHRKEKHLETVAVCRNNIENKCNFSAEMCWWNHKKINDNNEQENIKCFICGESFQNLVEMMSHRKRNHPDAIRQCFQFSRNNCRYQSEFCWYKHHENKKDGNDEKMEEDELNSVFRTASTNSKPPLQKKQN